jgi:hypothetical protein
MAVDELDARVVGFEAEDDVASSLHAGDIAPHWHWVGLTWVVALTVGVSVRGGASDDLELVAVKVPRVAVRGFIINDDFNNIAVLNGKRVGVDAVDSRVHLVLLRDAQGGVEGWNLLRQVGNIVDDGAGNTVDKGEVEVQEILLGDGTEEGLVVVWLDRSVIDRGHNGVGEAGVWWWSSELLVIAKLTKNSCCVSSERALEHGRIEHSKNSCIRRSIGFGSDEDFISLSGADIKSVRRGWLCCRSVEANDGHFKALEVEEERREGTNVQDVEEIGLSWLDVVHSRLAIVHDRTIGDWRDRREISSRLEEFDDVNTLLVIPVGKRKSVSLVIMSVIRRVPVVDNERATESIRILALIVRCVRN